jgi:hypothetical protein
VSLGGVESKTNESLTFPLPLRLDTIIIYCREVEGGGGDRSSGRGNPAEGRGEYRLNNAKISRILTFPSSPQPLSIDIDPEEEEWGVPCSFGWRDQPRNCGSHPVNHHDVSFGCDTMQSTQNTHLPLVSRD